MRGFKIEFNISCNPSNCACPRDLSPGTSGTLPAIFVIFFMYEFPVRDPGKSVQSAGCAGAGFLAFFKKGKKRMIPDNTRFTVVS
jgi:hypothetical protein